MVAQFRVDVVDSVFCASGAQVDLIELLFSDEVDFTLKLSEFIVKTLYDDFGSCKLLLRAFTLGLALSAFVSAGLHFREKGL